MPHTEQELHDAASHVQGEWSLLIQTAAQLPTHGVRTAAEDAAMEATLVHARCLINFCCGGYKGARNAQDIQPRDFLGLDWWPREEDFDRKMRGRLRFINENLAHLSWRRVLDKSPLIVSLSLLVNEVHWAMHLFVEELHARNAEPWASRFAGQEQLVARDLPNYRGAAETKPHLAPGRQNPTPP